MRKVRLNIIGLSYSQTQSGAYALILGEEDGQRRLPIIIGGFEAQSIAIAMENEVVPPRPLTHDLFKAFATEFGIKILEVIIHKLQDGVFYASLITEHNGNELHIDARTSDAVALAVRFNCPIYTTEEILLSAGIVLDDENKDTAAALSAPMAEAEEPLVEKEESYLHSLTVKQLEELLASALGDEDYEKAAEIRDEINKRKKS
jgi:uncharacterized protein